MAKEDLTIVFMNDQTTNETPVLKAVLVQSSEFTTEVDGIAELNSHFKQGYGIYSADRLSEKAIIYILFKVKKE